MHSFKETRVMKYDADLISMIVMDIEKYPEFLPWCTSATILSEGGNTVTAKLEVSFNGFTEGYISKVSKEEKLDHILIIAEAISGPFSHLKNVWLIKRLKNGAEVNFSIDFEFKSKILNMVIGMVFSVATKKMIIAFETRANELSAR